MLAAEIMSLDIAIIFAAALLGVSPSPSPAPSPTATPSAHDLCGTRHTALLAALNRPTVGYSACAVKPGDTVGEFGYANEVAAGASASAMNVTYPQGMVRYGVRPNFELDLLGPAYGVARSGGALRRGWLDSGLGAKLQAGGSCVTSYAVDVLYTAPTGAAAFTLGGPAATVNLDASVQLSPALSLGTTIGFTSTPGRRIDGTNARLTALLPSVVVTDQFTGQAQLYLEAYGATRIRPDGGSRFALDGGLQYLLTPAFELDVEAGRTATDLARSHYLGFGLGIRV